MIYEYEHDYGIDNETVFNEQYYNNFHTDTLNEFFNHMDNTIILSEIEYIDNCNMIINSFSYHVDRSEVEELLKYYKLFHTSLPKHGWVYYESMSHQAKYIMKYEILMMSP